MDKMYDYYYCIDEGTGPKSSVLVQGTTEVNGEEDLNPDLLMLTGLPELTTLSLRQST